MPDLQVEWPAEFLYCRHSTENIIESTIDRGCPLTISGIFPCARSSGERPMNGQVSSSTVGIALRI